MPPLCFSEHHTTLSHTPCLQHEHERSNLHPLISASVQPPALLLFLLPFSASACCSLPQIMTIIPAQREWPPPSHSHLCLSEHPQAAAHIHPKKQQQQRFPIILHHWEKRRCLTMDFGVVGTTWDGAFYFDSSLSTNNHPKTEENILLQLWGLYNLRTGTWLDEEATSRFQSGESWQ